MAVARGFFELGTTVAALTHFSAMSCRRMSSVVVTDRPPASIWGHVSASGPHSFVVSSLRTCQTNCGAFHWLETCGASTTGAARAASKSAAVNSPCVNGVRPFSIRSSTRLRRSTIGESGGTTSWDLLQVSRPTSRPRGRGTR